MGVQCLTVSSAQRGPGVCKIQRFPSPVQLGNLRGTLKGQLTSTCANSAMLVIFALRRQRSPPPPAQADPICRTQGLQVATRVLLDRFAAKPLSPPLSAMLVPSGVNWEGNPRQTVLLVRSVIRAELASHWAPPVKLECIKQQRGPANATRAFRVNFSTPLG